MNRSYLIGGEAETLTPSRQISHLLWGYLKISHRGSDRVPILVQPFVSPWPPILFSERSPRLGASRRRKRDGYGSPPRRLYEALQKLVRAEEGEISEGFY